VIDGSLHGHTLSGMAGVANTGTDRNWCGHPFAAANWFAFGRLAWDPDSSAEAIARDWLRMTFTTDARFVEACVAMMLSSREAVVNYMTPLGLHHLMARDHHYGPGPWVDGGRPDWTSLYYHRADRHGIGFDRTPSGSNSVATYAEPVRRRFADLTTCPESLLLWFHHVGWGHVTSSGRQLWDELCHRYHAGVAGVRDMQRTWDELSTLIDPARHEHVKALLSVQEQEARWWRDACLLYFQSISGRPFPQELEPLSGTLEQYMNITHSYVPGI
jgi:alpha-glucuronidase